MRFLPLETCKKLVEMGCKSESDFFYCSLTTDPKNSYYHWANKLSGYPMTPAFCLEDFLGSHEQAKLNCALVDDPIGFGIYGFRDELQRSDDWVKYIEELVG